MPSPARPAYLVDHGNDGCSDGQPSAAPPLPASSATRPEEEIVMRSLLLFLLGVPIPIIILIWLFT